MNSFVTETEEKKLKIIDLRLTGIARLQISFDYSSCMLKLIGFLNHHIHWTFKRPPEDANEMKF